VKILEKPTLTKQQKIIAPRSALHFWFRFSLCKIYRRQARK